MSGGQATNSGINYQQRVSAFFLISMYAEFDISSYLENLTEQCFIEKIFFETENPIDDLVIECRPYNRLFLQIKRSVSLSTKEGSDFVKTMEQFALEFISNPHEPSNYGIVTSSKSSRTITFELKKILNSINLNDESFNQNPLNKSEENTLFKFKTAFLNAYKKHSKRDATEFEFLQFSKRCFVSELNIDSGQTLEKSSMLLLESKGFKHPESVWAVLIKNSLSYASQRLSIQKSRLIKILKRYQIEENEIKIQKLEELLKTDIIQRGDYSVGKDVLLIESSLEEYDYLIVEFQRFGDDCKKLNNFFQNKGVLNRIEVTVIQRASTIAGIERYISENEEKFSDSNIGISFLDQNEIIDNNACLKLQKAHLQNLLIQNSNILSCLHCEKNVGIQNCLVVEIDDQNSQEAIGMVHTECLRPIDRIVGRPDFLEKEYDPYLKKFDYKTWVRLSLNGQGMMKNFPKHPERTLVIAWNSEIEYDRDYSYCVRFILEDGTISYVKNRGKIVRMGMVEAKNEADRFNRIFKEMRNREERLCYTSQTKTFGNYFELMRIKNLNEEILEIRKAEYVKYSKQIARIINSKIEYYAPLCLIRDCETEKIVNFSNLVPIISNPVNFKDFVKNWKVLGFDLSNIELKIIKTDKDFDNQMRLFFKDEMNPIINPEFDENRNLIRGLFIEPLKDVIENRKTK